MTTPTLPTYHDAMVLYGHQNFMLRAIKTEQQFLFMLATTFSRLSSLAGLKLSVAEKPYYYEIEHLNPEWDPAITSSPSSKP